MPEEKERPRPHGDPLQDAAEGSGSNREENQAQSQSDAAPEALTGADGREETDRDNGRGSTANGIPASDEDDGARRRQLYKDGATLVSRID